MENETDKYIQRINELTKYLAHPSLRDHSLIEEAYSGALSLTTILYSSNSNQLKSLIDIREKAFAKGDFTYAWESLKDSLKGFLHNLSYELKNNLIKDKRKEYSGSIFADFILLAKKAISDEHKDVAAVLGCAALEDALKKFAIFNSLDVEDKEMSEVLNALKSESLIPVPQAKILRGFIDLRNKAFHAQWDKIKIEDVNGLIYFVDKFVYEKF